MKSLVPPVLWAFVAAIPGLCNAASIRIGFIMVFGMSAQVNNTAISQATTAIIAEAMEQDAPCRHTGLYLDYGVEDIPAPPAIISVGGVGVVFREGLTALTGPKKAGKTSLIRLFLAAILSDTPILGISAKTSLKTVIFDTEQPNWRILHQIDKAFEMAGKRRQRIDNIHVICLREIETSDRLPIIIDVVEDQRPDIIIIDGIADLLDDFNDIAQSRNVLAQLLAQSNKYRMGIIAVLHTNPGDTSGKPRGHLGTELGNKAEATILVVKTDGKYDVTFDSRGTPIESFSFAKSSSDDIILVNPPEVSMHDKAPGAKEVIYVNMAKGNKYTIAEIDGIVREKGYNYSDSHIRTALRDLTKEGKVLNHERGKYALR